MGFTDPFTGVIVPRKMTDAELANAIRLDIIAELDATSLYHSHMLATDNPQAKAILAHIKKEEEEHIAEFMEMLKILDPTQAQELAEAPTDFAEAMANPASPENESTENQEDRGSTPGSQTESMKREEQQSQLTVGDMFMSAQQ